LNDYFFNEPMLIIVTLRSGFLGPQAPIRGFFFFELKFYQIPRQSDDPRGRLYDLPMLQTMNLRFVMNTIREDQHELTCRKIKNFTVGVRRKYRTEKISNYAPQ
jgi:hypothetical protein